MKRIAYKRENDGGVSIIIPAPEFMAKFESEAEALKELRKRSLPAGSLDVIEMQAEDQPKSTLFREAFKIDKANKKVVHDMKKARKIHMDRIREMRNQKLKELDVEEIKNLESKSKLKQVRDLKQKLRDIPQTIDLDKAKDVEELKDIWDKDIDLHFKYKEVQ